MKVVGIIPMRGGSKRLPGKNTKMFHGKPLGRWAIEAIAHAHPDPAKRYPVWVSTDDDEIARTYESIAQIHRRPTALGSDTTTSEEVISDWIRSCPIAEADVVVFAQATSPFITSGDVIRSLMWAMQYSVCVSVSAAPRSFFNGILVENRYSPSNISDRFLKLPEEQAFESPRLGFKRSQRARGDNAPLRSKYEENGAFWTFNREHYLGMASKTGSTRTRDAESHQTRPILMAPWWRGLEIDTQDDFDVCEAIAQKFDWRGNADRRGY